jgi:predicted metal-dependent peptidase
MSARRICDARLRLLESQPFWGHLALRLEIVEEPGLGTAATDGSRLFYDPAYVERLSADEVIGLVAEEVAHNVLGHSWRRSGRDLVTWNKACDYAIAHELRAAGFNTGDMLFSEKYAGWSAERIYDDLVRIDHQQRQSPSPSSQSGSGESAGESKTKTAKTKTAKKAAKTKAGQKAAAPPLQPSSPASIAENVGGRIVVLDAPTNDESGMAQNEWKAAAKAALGAEASTQTASAASALVRKSGVLPPPTPWAAIVLNWAQVVTADDYSWRRPSRAHVPMGIYLPALKVDRITTLVVAVDTSGSITSWNLGRFAWAVQQVLDEVRPTQLIVLYADCVLQGREEYEPGDLVRLKAPGRGGTSFDPVLRDVAKMEAEGCGPAGLIYFTDLQGGQPETWPQCPILWVVWGNSSPAYRLRPDRGDVVCIDDEEEAEREFDI